MKKLKGIFIETYICLLIQLLNKTQAECTWGTGTKNCDVSCSFLTPRRTMEILEQGWNEVEHESCHADGITLELYSVNYINVDVNFFTAKVKVKELMFSTSYIGIQPNAFVSNALKDLKKLTVPWLIAYPIQRGVFNGLELLEELYMQPADLTAGIEIGILNPLNRTLKHFSLKASIRYWPEISINGFTGSDPLTALTNVKYEYNLTSTIKWNSFLGLTNVVTLDLSDCQIQTIGAGAFDPISNTVKDLNLRHNRIITLPDGIFHNILITNIATISLEDNQLECNCNLMPFKLTYIENENANFGSVTCYNPSNLRDHYIASVDFCDDYTTTTACTITPTEQTTTSTTTEHTTPTEQATTNIPTEPPSTPEEFSQICYEAVDTAVTKNVSIKTPRSGLRINENVDGYPTMEMNVTVENSVFIWFSQFDRETYHVADDHITCVISSEKVIRITGLEENVAYTFCLMNSVEKTVSPLDCISYRKAKDGLRPWIYQDKSSLIISMGVLACCVSVLIGSVIGFFTLNHIRKNQSQMACINDVLRDTNFTDDCYTVDLENAPPLPARAYPMQPVEQPIYAEVRD